MNPLSQGAKAGSTTSPPKAEQRYLGFAGAGPPEQSWTAIPLPWIPWLAIAVKHSFSRMKGPNWTFILLAVDGGPDPERNLTAEHQSMDWSMSQYKFMPHLGTIYRWFIDCSHRWFPGEKWRFDPFLSPWKHQCFDAYFPVNSRGSVHVFPWNNTVSPKSIIMFL